MAKITFSVVVPFRNEVSNLPALHAEICASLAELGGSSEIIYIDDGSTDDSSETLIRSIPPPSLIPVKLVRFWRNFGQTAAISAGIDASRGEFVGFLDADGQNPPADLLHLLRSFDPGIDAVFGWRKIRHDDLARTLVSKIANWLIRIIFHITLKDMGCATRVVRREAITSLRLYGETHRILPLLLVLRGIRFKEQAVSHRTRSRGSSKYGYSRSVKLIIDIITTKFLDSYSTKPAYIFGTGGLISLGLSLPAFAQVIYRKFWLGVYVHNNPMFIIAMFLVLIGVNFILLGLMSELMIRVYFETRQKPIYEIRETIKL